MRLIDGKWKLYETAVIADGAGLTQIEETKKAFYAGIATMFEIATSAPTLLNNVEEFKTMMENIDEELNDFLDELGGPDESTVN